MRFRSERARSAKHEALLKKVLDGFGNDDAAKAFVHTLLSRKPRYTRDQLSMLLKLQEKHDRNDLARAIEYCHKRELFSASDFGDSLEYLVKTIPPQTCFAYKLPVKYSVIRAEQRPIDAYTQLARVGDAP